MSWRTGAALFAEMWPLIQAKVKPAHLRRRTGYARRGAVPGRVARPRNYA